MKFSEQALHKFILFTLPIRPLIQWCTKLIAQSRKAKVILVFGLSRSGTTMLGTFLALSPASKYFHEPEKEPLMWKYKEQKKKSPDIGEFWQYALSEEPKRFKAHALACILLRVLLETPKDVDTFCVKPIYLMDVMEEATQGLDFAHVLYISRHPCGRSDSILRQRTKDHIKDNPEEVEKILEKISNEWGRVTKNVLNLFKNHPAWYWVIFEDLANNPVQGFRELYKQFGLSWSVAIETTIHDMTTGEDGGFYDVQRNSKAQTDKWKMNLTEEQIELIRKNTTIYNTNIYTSF